MTLYQLRTRIAHFFRAKHWRGAAIHSPMMYAFVRKYAIENRGEQLIVSIGAPVINSVGELKNIKNENIIILREPFRNRSEKFAFEEWYASQSVVVAHFQGAIVIFFDEKLKKQRYMIRN